MHSDSDKPISGPGAQLLNASSSSHIMSALFESMEDAIIVGDVNGRIIFGNEAAIRMNDNSQFPVDPEERALHYTIDKDNSHMNVGDLPLRRALAEGEVHGLELTLMTPQGNRKNIICNGRALFSDKNEKVGAVLIVHDRTHEKSTEQDKTRLEGEMVELLRMNEQLERFASVAAHDLKSPLNSITQFVDLLRDRLGDKVGREEIELMNFISKAGGRLRLLIDDLLSYARSGKNVGEMTSVDLGTVLESVTSSISGDLKLSNAEIETDPLPVVVGDLLGLSRVFQNIITNAIKYRREATPKVQIKSFEEPDKWRIEIKDNGTGIRKEDQAAAFELFKRIDVSSKREGTGLGLPICRRVIEAHGGSIWLDSEFGVGTTVIFTLPKRAVPPFGRKDEVP